MDEEIVLKKKNLRRQMKNMRQQYLAAADTDALQKIEEYVAGQLLDRFFSETEQPTGALFAYWSIQQEVPTHRLIEKAVERNIPVFLPKVTGKKREMCFVPYTGWDHMMEGAYGILEPTFPETSDHMLSVIPCDTDMPVSDYMDCLNCWQRFFSLLPGKRHLMLVPGLAFDSQNMRLGYGGGYYDTYLTSPLTQWITTLGLAYDFQVVEQVPCMPHDGRVQELLTVPRSVYL